MPSLIHTEPPIRLLLTRHTPGPILHQLAIFILAELDLEPVDCYAGLLAYVGEAERVGAETEVAGYWGEGVEGLESEWLVDVLVGIGS